MKELNYLLNEVFGGSYTVCKGDTLDSIAKRFNTTKRLIMLDNFLDEEVEIGTVLYIKIYKVIHTVKLNESIEDIAATYNTGAQEILNLNKTSQIYPYMQLVIK